MRPQKKPVKKERNYSIWFTGIVLIMVYMILLDNTSGRMEKGCKSILKAQVWDVAENILEAAQEKENISDLDEP